MLAPQLPIKAAFLRKKLAIRADEGNLLTMNTGSVYGKIFFFQYIVFYFNNFLRPYSINRHAPFFPIEEIRL